MGEDVVPNNLPSDKETREHSRFTDKSDDQSPSRKRKQEEGESGWLSNGKEQGKDLGLAKEKAPLGISMKLGSLVNKKQKTESPLKKKTGTAASAFNDSDDDSDNEEEMPREARMRMRNLGKETPTSAGPNSFNKGKRGFTHQLKVWEKSMKSPTPSETAQKKQ